MVQTVNYSMPIHRAIVFKMFYSTMSRIFSALKGRIPELQIHFPVVSVTSVFQHLLMRALSAMKILVSHIFTKYMLLGTEEYKLFSRSHAACLNTAKIFNL